MYGAPERVRLVVRTYSRVAEHDNAARHTLEVTEKSAPTGETRKSLYTPVKALGRATQVELPIQAARARWPPRYHVPFKMLSRMALRTPRASRATTREIRRFGDQAGSGHTQVLKARWYACIRYGRDREAFSSRERGSSVLTHVPVCLRPREDLTCLPRWVVAIIRAPGCKKDHRRVERDQQGEEHGSGEFVVARWLSRRKKKLREAPGVVAWTSSDDVILAPK